MKKPHRKKQGQRFRRPSREEIQEKPRGPRSWNWGDKFNSYSVWLTPLGVYWAWEGEKDQGGGAEQTRDDFLKNGPLDYDAPPDIVAAVRAAVLEEMAKEEDRELIRPPPDFKPDPPEAFVPAFARGLAILIPSVLLVGLVALASMTAAKYVALFAPMGLGLAAIFHSGRASTAMAALISLACCIFGVHALERYAEVVRSPVIRLGAIEGISNHPQATRVLVAGASAQPQFSGTATRRRTRQYGAGQREETQSARVMPLTSKMWRKDMPVEAWLECSGSDAFCQVQAQAGRFVASRDGDKDLLQAAVANARQTHALTAAAHAPVLSPHENPETAPERYIWSALLALAGSIALLAISLIAWRAIDIRRRNAT